MGIAGTVVIAIRHLMGAPLNFGPGEQIRKQRPEIAECALAITLAEEKRTAEVQVFYDHYNEGKID